MHLNRFIDYYEKILKEAKENIYKEEAPDIMFRLGYLAGSASMLRQLKNFIRTGKVVNNE